MTTTIDCRFVLPLAEATTASEAGAKAANLSRLIALGHPVPDGFVVPAAALELFLDCHGLSAPISRICAELDGGDPARVGTAAATIAALLRDCALPPAVAADVDDRLSRFPGGTLIVRSSAIGEDSHDASFAGQLDSIGNVTGPAQLRQAIVDVWISRWSARALTYQHARRRSLAGVGVVVQRQIAAVVSGVLFTVSPEHRSEMLVEYCAGSGDALVSGRENPGRLAIARRNLTWSVHAAPETPSTETAVFLEDDRIRALAQRALAIEQAFGAPQDIEWTMDASGRIWIVQARPITTSAQPAMRRRAAHWSNANVNENFPEPITPLLYSIARDGYYHYFHNLGRAFGFSERRLQAMDEPLRQIIGVHGARMYYNLSSIHGVLRSAPFGDHLAAWFNQFVGSDDTDAPAHVDRSQMAATAASRWTTRVREASELIVIAAGTAWQYLFLSARVERFERTVDAFARETHPDRLAQQSRETLLDRLRGFVDIRNNRWKDASLADAASMVCYGALQRWLSAAFPARDQASLHNSLLKAIPGLPSGRPALELWDLSRRVRADERLQGLLSTSSAERALAQIAIDPGFADFHAALTRFLDDWGFRCSGELMLTVPSFQERPAPLLDLIRAYAAIDAGSPHDQLETQRAERVAETARVAAVLRRRRLLRLLPGLHQWHVVSRLLSWTERAILLRERARLKQALLYSRLRRIALALGERLAAEGTLDRPDDLFFLTAQEIDDFVSGYAMFPGHVRALVALRRQAHRELSARVPPDAMSMPAGSYAWPADAPAGRSPSDSRAVDQDGAMALTGTAVCGGRTTARAGVIDDVTQAHLLRAGDVLVTRQTDPGWGAVFPMISGLVMERGGMLSHGAIIAREFGIPSVVGIANATRLIPHGATVSVDGDRGVVRLETPAC